MVINLEAKRVDLLSSYNSIQRVHFVNEAFKVVGFMSQLLKNSFKRNDVNINNLHPQYADIVGDPKLLVTFFFFMYSFSILIGSYVNNMSQIILVIADVILGCMLFSICNIGMEVVLIEPLIL